MKRELTLQTRTMFATGRSSGLTATYLQQLKKKVPHIQYKLRCTKIEGIFVN